MTPLPSSAYDTIDKRNQFLVPCVNHFYRNPPVIIRGSGNYLYDREGRPYLDMFSGVSVNNLGHCHPNVVRAITNQAKILSHTTTIYLTEPMLELAEKLLTISPASVEKVFFCTSGSEANETAVFFAQHFTGKAGILALSNSLHGNTKMTMSLTGIAFWKTDIEPVASVRHVVSPYCFRCPFKQCPTSCNLECVEELEDILATHSDQYATVIIEAIQGNGGIIVPPEKWFEKLRELKARYDFLLIVDEVQTGFGRTGSMFACDHFRIEPDIITIAKAVGGGLPMGAVLASNAVAEKFTMPRASTFGGNCIAAKAGSAVIETIINENLVEKAAKLGDYFKDCLFTLKSQYPEIGDVRGIGLMIGVEMIKNDKTALEAELVDNILESMKDFGVLAGKGGPHRNVLIFMPPLTIKKDEINKTITVIKDVLQLLLDN